MKSSKGVFKILSMLLAFSMFISNISVVFGASSSSMTAGSGSYTASGGANNGCVWDEKEKEQFLRISLFMAPREETNSDTPPNIDWSSGYVSQIGKTFDWTSERLSANVVYHSNFTNAKDYSEYSYANQIKSGGYLDKGQTFQIETKLKDNWGNGIDFPRPVGNIEYQGQYIKDYFSLENSKSVMNEVLWLLKETAGQTAGDGTGINGLSVDWLDSGTFINEYGEKNKVAYLLIVEPGVYAYVNEKMSAYTLRDALAWHKSRGSAVDSVNPLSWNPSSCYELSKALTLEENTSFNQIGLQRGNESSHITGDEVKSLRDSCSGIGSKLSRFMGVGTSIYWGNGEPIVDMKPLPIIKYYYEFDKQSSSTNESSSTDEGLLEDDEQEHPKEIATAPPTNMEMFRAPDYIEKTEAKKSSYLAELDSVPNGVAPESGAYELSGFYILNTKGDAIYEKYDTMTSYDVEGKVETVKDNYASGGFALNGYIDVIGNTAKFIQEDEKGNVINSDYGYWLTTQAANNILDYATIFQYTDIHGTDWSGLADGKGVGLDEEGHARWGTLNGSVGKVDNEASREFVRKEAGNDVNNIASINAMASNAQKVISNKELNPGEVKSAVGGVTFPIRDFNNKDLQLVLLYTKNGKPLKRVYVNKYFYSREEDGTENLEEVVTEDAMPIINDYLDGAELPEYSIKDSVIDGGDTYFLSEWASLEDEIPMIPDVYDDWEAVLEKLDTADEEKGNTPGGWNKWINPDRELNIKYVRLPMPTNTPNPEETEGNVILHQNKITKAFDLEDTSETGVKKTIYFKWSAEKDKDSHNCGGKNCPGHPCSEMMKDSSLDLVDSILNRDSFNKELIATTTNFKSFDVNSHEHYDRTTSGETVYMDDYDHNYILWRGQDVPVLADYKYVGKESKNYNIINELIQRNAVYIYDNNLDGNKRDKYRHVNNGSSYTEDYKLKVGKADTDTNGNVADYRYTTKHSYNGVTWTKGSAKGNDVTYDTTAQINVYYGERNIGNDEVVSVPNVGAVKSLDGNIAFDVVNQYGINNTQPLKFFPYVEMTYDYVTNNSISENIAVYTLAGHESEMYPRDFIEVGYKTYGSDERDTTTGLVIESQQWSLHKKALELSKDKPSFDKSVDHTARVIPGGAVYRLRTPNEGEGKANRTKVLVRNYLTYVPDDVASTGALKEGGTAFSLNNQLARKDGLLHQIKRSLNSLDVVQVSQDKNGNSIKLNQGDKGIKGASGKQLSQDAKYWLNQGLVDGLNDGAIAINSDKANEADLDIIGGGTKTVDYRIQSDTTGTVTVTRTGDRGSQIWSITKTQDASEFLKIAELADLDNKTKLITNYLNSIDRNKGSDENGNTWYNESFDGISVKVVEDIFEIGFNDNQLDLDYAVRTAVIDPKLQPVRDGQSDLFDKGVYSHFETNSKTNMGGTSGYMIKSHGISVTIPNYKDADGYVGTFCTFGDNTENIEVYMPNMKGMYRSKDFIIPNVSVMDLY